MKFNYRNLRGKIVAKYGSQKEFAKALNTTKNTVSRKLSNATNFSHEDMVKWSEMLDIDLSEVGKYFFD